MPSDNKSVPKMALIEVNVGCIGNGRVAFSLSNINITDGMVGL